MVQEVEWPVLATYERKPYFWTEGAATGVFFRAPVNGATTPNSSNPRSELRQMYPNGDPAAWNNKTATWTMEAEMAFTAIPTSSDATRGTVGMQLHDGNDDVTVLRLEKNGDLWLTQGDDTHAHAVTGSYVMGTFMDVKLESRKGGGVRWYINGTFEYLAAGTVSGCYYKAGAYTQTGPGATGYGETCFKSLKVWRS